jgi:hypothetical protein
VIQGRSRENLLTVISIRVKGKWKNCLVFSKRYIGAQKKRQRRNLIAESEGEAWAFLAGFIKYRREEGS